MKCLLLLMLIASYVLADTGLPSINDDSSTVSDGDHTDLIVLMLQQLTKDVEELNAKTDTLQSTTDSLKATVGSLSLRVRNIEEDVTGLKETDIQVQQDISDLLESKGTNAVVITHMQQQINDLSNAVDTNVTALSEEDQVLQSLVADLSSEVQMNVTALSDEDREIQQLVTDLSAKEQADYIKFDADIAMLESTAQENYDELKGDINTLNTTICALSYSGYFYAFVDTLHEWDDARQNCINKGGDLAYHGLDSMAFREELLCDHFGLCDNGVVEYPWFGLRRYNGMWEYLDQTPAPDDILWATGEYDHSGEDCGMIFRVEYGYSNFLETVSYPCSWTYRSVCEFKC